MRFKLSLLIAFFSLKQAIKAEDLQGVIFNSQTKEPVIAAVVKNQTSHQVALTDHKGNFVLKNVHAQDSITISSLGYQNSHIIFEHQAQLALALEPISSQLNEIVVTANREQSLRNQTPVSIAKVSARIIDETKATAAYEILNKVPGVLMVNLGNEQHAMSIRQPMTTSNYYLYLEDGLPIRPMGIFNHNALLEINQFTISAIEVVKGPASSVYGPEAIGGTVNFISQRPTSIPTAKIGMQFDNFGYQRLQFGAGAQTGKFGFYIGGLTSKQTGSWMTRSDYDKTSINSRLEYHFDQRTRLIGTFVYSDFYSQTAGSADSTAFYSRSYTSNNDFSYRQSKAIRSKLMLEKNWNMQSSTSFTAFYRDNNMGQNPSYSISWSIKNPTVSTGQINNNAFKSYGGLIQHQQKFNLFTSQLIAGILYDYSPNSYDAYQTELTPLLRADGLSVEKYILKAERPDVVLSDYDANINNAAAYLQYDFHPLTRLTVSAGMRYDNMYFSYHNFTDHTEGNKHYNKLTPKVGATYNFSPRTGVYANYSLGFAPPALTAVFRKSNITGNFNYNLKAASFNNHEIGGWIALFKNKLTADFSLYLLKGHNELLSIRQTDNTYEYQSAGKTLHRGIELGLNAQPVKELNFRFGGTAALHRFEDFEISNKESDALQNLAGYEMPSAPRFTWNTELSYHPNWLPLFRTSLEWQHVGEFYQNQINTVTYRGYELFNFRLGYQWKSVEVFGNLMNLTDRLYAYNATRGNGATDKTTFTPAAPRTFVFGIQFNFAEKQNGRTTGQPKKHKKTTELQ